MTYSPYGEIKELDDEEKQRLMSEESERVQIRQEGHDRFAAIERQLQEQTAEPTDQSSTSEQAPQPKPEQQQTAKDNKPQKQVPGWGPDPKPEDRWNIRKAGPVKSEMEGMIGTGASEAVLAPAVGTVDGFVGLYNSIAPEGIKSPEIPQFQNEDLQVIRQFSSFIGPNLIGMRLLGTAVKGLQGVSAIPAKVHRLGANPVFKMFAVTGAEMGIGGAIDVALHKDGDDNAQRQLRELLKTPESERLFGIFPSSWATDNTSGNVGPDQNRARVRNEGMGLGVLAGLADGLVRVVGASMDTRAATKWVAKDDLAKKWFEKIQNDEFAQTKYSEDPIQDSLLRSESRIEHTIDELGEFYVARANQRTLTKVSHSKQLMSWSLKGQ